MNRTPEAPPLAPDAAGRLADLARTCKAAVRAVGLYPPGHPAIRLAVDRLTESAARGTSGGPLHLSVQPEGLRVGDRAPARPDAAVGELAALLHHHRIARLTLNGGTDAESWRTLLLLLARAPEEVQADGGIAAVWGQAGGPSIEIVEIDYAALLRERLGDPDTLEAVLAWCTAGSVEVELDDRVLAAVAGLAGDPEMLGELARAVQMHAAGGTPAERATAMLRLMRALAGYVARAQPAELPHAIRNMARVVGRLTPDVITALLDRRGSVDAMAGAMNVVQSVAAQVPDDDVAHFVAGSVVAEGGATERLASAFQALVPEPDRKPRLLDLARREAAESPLGGEEGFPEIWARVEKMLTSYSDRPYVSDEYARELSAARARAIDVEQAADDPPERLAGWLATVGDSALRALDRQLLFDLLAIERDPSRWRDLADTVVSHVQDLVRVGHLDPAAALVGVLVQEAEQGGAELAPLAREALDRLARGPLARAAAAGLRTCDEAGYELVARLCHALGPSVIRDLAEALAGEQDGRTRRRLREILVRFGTRGRAAVEELMSAPNWELRRTAAYLLRELGGVDTLASLEPLLNDSEPRVQREALRALLLVGDERASEMLLRALVRASARTRDTIATELGSLRDERAAPLCCHLLRHADHRSHADVYLATLDALGSLGGADAVGALRDAMYRGEWWAPFRTRALRAAAAAALRKIGSLEAVHVLREASIRAPRGVRAAARAELARLTDTR